jgi:dTDP-L-rhamnose 4-epimerase
MRVLVTGGAGFIGSFLVEQLVAKGHDVVVFDNLDPQVHPARRRPAYLSDRAHFVKGDVTDYLALKREVVRAEIVFHLAAAVGVGQSQYEISKYVDVNIGGTANLLDILANRKHTVKKVIVAGSMSAYGEGPYDCAKCGVVRVTSRDPERLAGGLWEPLCPKCSSPLAPLATAEDCGFLYNSIYAITKGTQEEMTRAFSRAYPVPSVVLRFFNVFGPRQSLSNPYTGVMAIFLSRIKNGKPPVVFEDGMQMRDFVSVHDIAEACILAMEKDGADNGVFNVGGGGARTVKFVAEKLISAVGSPVAPEITNKCRKGDIRHCVGDITAARNAMGYAPRTAFEDGIRELVEWSATAEARDNFDAARAQLARKGLL